MDSYNQALEKAKKDGKVKDLTPEYIKFEKKGQSVVGKCISVQAVSSARGDKPYNQYVFDTDNGHVKFALGNNADKEFGNSLIPGRVFQIQFQGQVEVGQGRRVNKFQILELVDESAEPEPDETTDDSGESLDKE